MDWDDLRVFLEVARSHNVRAAADQLKLHHSTVSRRIRQFETGFDMRLFERTASGMVLTAKGEELRTHAEGLEANVLDIQRRMTGHSSELAGILRVTMPDVLLTHLLMPAIADFIKAHPQVDLEVVTTYDVLEVGTRDADIALRSTTKPAEHLVGRRLARKAMCAYVSQSLLTDHGDDLEELPWLGWGRRTENPVAIPKTIQSEKTVGWFDNSAALAVAAKEGLGAVILPCFVGDKEPGLMRLQNQDVAFDQDIWILTHRDLIPAARVRAFFDAMIVAILGQRELIEGNLPAGQDLIHKS